MQQTEGEGRLLGIQLSPQGKLWRKREEEKNGRKLTKLSHYCTLAAACRIIACNGMYHQVLCSLIVLEW